MEWLGSPCLILTLTLTVHRYKKALRSKDLSSASSKDLDCVFGRRGRKERRERERGERGGGEAEEEGEEEEKKERTKRTKTEGASENEVYRLFMFTYNHHSLILILVFYIPLAVINAHTFGK